MNAERLLALYEKVAEAPDAIARLRRFVLDLAVRGKLVGQDPNDEPASELLKRIASERGGMVAAGKIKRHKSLPAVDDNPFPIPPTWEWVRLGELGFTQTGSTPPKSRLDYYGCDVPFIRPGDLYPSWVDYSGEGLTLAGAEASGRLAPSGSVLMVCIGTIGKSQMVDRVVSFNQQINALTPLQGLSPEFVLLAFQSDYFQELAWAASARTTIAILNKGNWEKLPVPIPSFAEQRRIVAKVDELMALLDQLEAARNTREATRDRLTAASFDRLTAPDTTPEVFPIHARFALDALAALTSRADQIKSLRQTILNLAVRGKLVAQDPNDEPASELLERIVAENISSGKRQKEVPEIDRDDLGEFPPNWSAVPLIDLGDWAIGAGFPKNEQGQTEGPYFFLKVSDMNLPENDKFIRTANNFIDGAAAKRMRAAIHPPGTIIFPKIGGAIATNKRRILTRGSAIDNNCLGITFSSYIETEWAYLLMTSLDFSLYQAGTAVPALQQGTLAAIPVALPPLAEQHRIVAKVDELMAFCDRLEASLATADTTKQRLLEALLHEALEPTLKEAA